MDTIIIYNISRRDIEDCDTSCLLKLVDDWPRRHWHHLKDHFNSLMLAVDGYNDHPEEIYMIPEVRAYFTKLHCEWPWWLYFLRNEGSCIAMAYLCLLKSVQGMKREGDPNCMAAFDPEELLPILQHDFSRMNFLMDAAGMSERENENRTEEIFRIFIPDFKFEPDPFFEG